MILLESCANQSVIACAMLGPIPSMDSSMSCLAFSIPSREPKLFASRSAMDSPTPRIPRALISRFRGCCFETSIDSSRLSAFLSANPSRDSSISFRRMYISETSFTRPAFTICSASFDPSPAISIASRDAKCSTLRISCAGQDAFTQ